MSASHHFLRIARQVHLYVGVFIAPALLFFALTGGLQVFSLHETTRGSDYKPPAWLVTLAQLHKHQSMAVSSHKPHPVEMDSKPAPHAAMASSTPAAHASAPMDEDAESEHAGSEHAESEHAAAKNPLPLKIYSALVALCLFISTLIGIYMAYRYTRKRVLITALWLAGIVVPVVLILM